MTILLLNQDQELTPQNFLHDYLHCDELYRNDNDHDDDDDGGDDSTFEEEQKHFISLLVKEKKTLISENVLESSKYFIMEIRREILEWMKRVNSYHNFSTSTYILSVNYFDKFILNVGFQSERPWMAQLCAIACISLASKFEEIHVPLLSQLQVDSKYIFEAKTIKRMELLILSTLEWNMNGVTPLTYFGHLMKMFRLKNRHHHREILRKCEALLVSAIADPRFLHYAPSILAMTTFVQTLKQFGLWKNIQHQIYLIDTFKLNKDKVEECNKFIQEISTNTKTPKRKWCTNSGDSSPTRVLDIDLKEASMEPSFVSLPSLDPDELVAKKCRSTESYC